MKSNTPCFTLTGQVSATMRRSTMPRSSNGPTPSTPSPPPSPSPLPNPIPTHRLLACAPPRRPTPPPRLLRVLLLRTPPRPGAVTWRADGRRRRRRDPGVGLRVVVAGACVRGSGVHPARPLSGNGLMAVTIRFEFPRFLTNRTPTWFKKILSLLKKSENGPVLRFFTDLNDAGAAHLSGAGLRCRRHGRLCFGTEGSEKSEAPRVENTSAQGLEVARVRRPRRHDATGARPWAVSVPKVRCATTRGC